VRFITNMILVLHVERHTRLNLYIFTYATYCTLASLIHYFSPLRTASGKGRTLGVPMLFSIFVTSPKAAVSSFCQFKLQCRKGI
jgi:hypothetical protein